MKKNIKTIALLIMMAIQLGTPAHAENPDNNTSKQKVYSITTLDHSMIYDPSIQSSIKTVIEKYLKKNTETEIIGDIVAESSTPNKSNNLTIEFNQTNKTGHSSKVKIIVSLNYTATGDGEGYGYGYYSVSKYKIVKN